jgi:hypothetical protein
MDAVTTLSLMHQYDLWLPKKQDEDRFHSDMRPFVVVGPDGKHQLITRIPRSVRQAVKALSEHPRPHFSDAFRAVQSVMKSKARPSP